MYKICLIFQPNIKYSIVGFSDSPDYFKIDETTGTISVKSDLRSDLSKRATYLVSWFLSYHFISTIIAAISIEGIIDCWDVCRMFSIYINKCAFIICVISFDRFK